MKSLITKIARNFAKGTKGTKTTHNAYGNLTMFSSKGYDEEYFNKINSTLPKEKQFQIEYIEPELNERTAKLIPKDTHTVVCFVNDKLNAGTIKQLKKHNIDLIAMRCAGYNNIDLLEAETQGMSIVRVPAYSPHAVAEHAITLLMALNRRIHKAYNRTKENNFSLEGLVGFDMYGKTAGIIGFGKIGQEFGRITNGFGMKTLVHDTFVPNKEQLEKSMNVQFVSLQEVLSQSDVLSLHCPLTPQTAYIINKSTIRIIKKNCIIVNTGRGALIDTAEAVKAIQEERIGGLALDVYEQEEGVFFSDHSSQVMKDATLARLLSFPNVLLTSHQAFFTVEALTQISSVTLHNILEFRETGDCANIVKRPVKK